MVIVLGTLRFPAARMPEVLPHLRRLVEATRRLDGCLAYDVAEDIDDPGLLRFAEVWPDAARLAAHLQAPHITPWREAAKRCGLLDRRFTAYDASGARMV
ncbi:MAG: putative quinol monooxygenase [Bauldia sp.]